MGNKTLATPPTPDDPNAPHQPPAPPLPPTVERHEEGEHRDSKRYGKQVQQEKVKPLHWASYVEAFCAVALVFITWYYTQAAFRQAKASEDDANAAKSAAETADTSLHIVERAYLIAGDPSEPLRGWVMIRVPISNTGHVPTGKTSLKVNYERTTPLGKAIEDRVMPVRTRGSIVPGIDTYNLIITMPHIEPADREQISDGRQNILIRGHFAYDDGFGRNDLLELCFGYHGKERRWENCSGASDDIWLNDAPQRDLTKLPPQKEDKN